MLGAAMKRGIAFIAALAGLAVLTGPLYAQGSRRQQAPTALQEQELQKKKDAEKAEREYEAMMKKTRGQAATPERVDPWQNMRSADDGKPKQ
jgi:hypothetical protein